MSYSKIIKTTDELNNNLRTVFNDFAFNEYVKPAPPPPPNPETFKCPRCNARLRTRSGKYGNFMGCSRYPYCKYTSNF